MIRLIFVVIFLLLYFILGLPVLGVLWLIGKRNKPAADICKPADRPMGIQSDPLSLRNKINRDRGRKCTKRPAGTLYCKPPELF